MKDNLCHKVAKNLAYYIHFGVLRKIELASDEIKYFAEVISKQHFEVVASFLLTVYSKMPREGSELKKEFLSKKGIRT